ncbi:UPF0722 protein C11orf88 homolog isoform X5 [Suricata suricatta]|uniref:UPF0722 protein C11orf88 homolog isoform X5 n=1 Tax=Suricata suricatta TaxID=37032 RepID=UPI001156ABDC|nr:UPF0722 protein C11orf88 homolog isoform X5 [Suricata suricatta]
METTPAGGRPSPTEAVEICPQGLLVFTGSSEKDSNLAKQFWITSSMYPTNESQLVMSREKICFRPCFIEKNKSPDVTAETPRTQGSEEKEKYLQKTQLRCQPLCARRGDLETSRMNSVLLRAPIASPIIPHGVYQSLIHAVGLCVCFRLPRRITGTVV